MRIGEEVTKAVVGSLNIQSEVPPQRSMSEL